MPEAVNLTGSSTKGILINCDKGISEDSRNRRLDSDGRDLSSGVYKRRKVSIKRNFPKGCGRHAQRINVEQREDGVAIGAVENTKIREDGEVKELVSVKHSESWVEPETVEMAKSSYEIDSPNFLNSLKYETTKSFEVLNQAEVLETAENEVPLALEIPKNSEWCQVNYQWTFDRSDLVDSSKTTSETESPNLRRSLIYETKNALEVSNEAEVHETPKNVVPVAMEIPKVSECCQVNYQWKLDHSELANPCKTLEIETIDLSKNFNQKELVDTVKNSNETESVNLLRNVSLPTEDLLSSSPLQSPIVSVFLDTSILSKVSDLPKMPIPVVEAVVGSIPSKYHPRRRISACRDSPPACGRNAPRISKEEYLKFVACSKVGSLSYEKSGGEQRSPKQMVKADFKQIIEKVRDGDPLKCKLKGNITKEIGDRVCVKLERGVEKEMIEHSHVREASESELKQEDTEENSIRPPDDVNMSQSYLKSPSTSKKADIEVGSSGAKLGKESLKVCKNTSFKRKLRGKCADEKCSMNQSQGESIGLGPSNDRVIVQALMAALNCPWREGKQTFRSPIGLTHGTDRSGVKKSELVEQENSKNDPRKKDEAENSEGKSTKKKMSPIAKVAYERMDLLRDSGDSPGHDEEGGNFQLVQRSQDLNLGLIPFGLNTLAGKDDGSEAVATRNKVRETLRLFQGIYRKFLRDEEAKLKEHVNGSGRIDLKSAKILKEKHKWVNTGKPILGPVPGVEVGDEFHYRVELAIIGLHRPFQGGIDYVRRDATILATSIVASGGYADIVDSSDVMIYSGQGGNPTGKGKKAEDQKLERGNLGLKNSMDERTPVRLIRGFKESKGSDSLESRGKMVATYTYDGLYLVENYWQEKGHHGTNVFKFKLRRIPGQPELALKEVKKSKKSRVREGLCVDDISQGKEKMPICAVNTIDDEKPPPFEYITNMIYPSWYNPIPPSGCDCTDGCSDSVKCVCVVKNGGEIPFNYDGAIVGAKPLVYECGPSCKCPPSCHNRVSQYGIKFQLEIFKTESRGWGVRSLTSISSGSFICEYTGELLHEKEADQRTGNDEYLFDIGNNYNDHALWEGLSTLIPPDLQSKSSHETVEGAGFTIDAAQYGSIGRFINHSCSPNLYAQNVLYDHDDKRMPHIMLFAAENIPPLQELTYHYNYTLDQVRDSDGNVKKKDCYCGSLECTGRMY